MYVNLNFLNLAVSVIGLVFMFCVETVRPKRAWEASRKKRLFFHVRLSVLNVIIVGLLATAPFLFWRNLVHSREWGISPLLGLKGPAEILIGLVVLDMFDYWWHRFNHRIPFLWRFHKVHHVDTHVDVTTALRFHPGELLISSTIVKPMWLLIWGPSLWGLAIFEASVTSASEFHHSNIDFPNRIEGLIRKIFVTPRFHASHHTVSKRTGDANFSAIFIFWDKLFGTYREPDFEEMRLLGLPAGREKYLSFTPTLKGPFTSEY